MLLVTEQSKSVHDAVDWTKPPQGVVVTADPIQYLGQCTYVLPRVNCAYSEYKLAIEP